MQMRFILCGLPQRTFGWSKDIADAIAQADAAYEAEREKKRLGKINQLTPPQTIQKVKTMKNLLFVTAVLLAVGELRQTKPQGFSVHDVTTRLREQVNQGDISFTDKSYEDVDMSDGTTLNTQSVEHSEVKALFNDLYANGVITGLDKSYATGYITYVNRPAQIAPAGTTTQPSVAGVSPIGSNSVIVTTGKAQGPFPTINNSLTQDKIRQYLSNTPKGQPRTMKQIQSRLKGYLATCEEIYNFLSKSYAMDNNQQNLPFSLRSVTMV
jgi:hypothetical protein